MTNLEPKMRLQMSDGKILEIVSIGFSDTHKKDVVVLKGTQSYEDMTSRSMVSKSQLEQKINDGIIKVVIQ